MAHDKEDSSTGTWTDAFARTPWWMCLALALGTYFVLHALAMRPHLILTDPSHLRAMLRSIVLDGLLEDLQYLAPLLFLVGVPLARCVASARIVAEHDATTFSACEFDLLVGEGLRVRRAAVAHA